MNTQNRRSPADAAAFANARIDVWSVERDAMRMRAGHAGGLLRGAAGVVGAALRRVATALRQRRAIAELSQLDDRLLADVGVRREDIVGLVAAGDQRRYDAGQAGLPKDDGLGTLPGMPSRAAMAQAGLSTMNGVQPATAANSDRAQTADRKVA